MKEKIRNISPENLTTIYFLETVSSKIYGEFDDRTIFSMVLNEFSRSKKYKIDIVLLTEDTSYAKVVKASITHQKARHRREEKNGVDKRKHSLIDLNGSDVWKRIIRKGETVIVNTGHVFKETLPSAVSNTVSKLFGHGRCQSIITPLLLFGKIKGAIAITVPSPPEHIIPAVRCFAGHLSKAIEFGHTCRQYKEAEKAIKIFKTFTDRCTDGIAIVNQEDRLIYVNKSFAAIHGYRREEMTGIPLKNVLAENNSNNGNNNCKPNPEPATSLSFLNGEVWHKRKDGTIFPVTLEVSVLDCENQKNRGLLLIVKPMSHKKNKKKRQEYNKSAFKNTLRWVEEDTGRVKNEIKQYIQTSILPLLGELKKRNNIKQLIDLIDQNMQNIMSVLEKRIATDVIKLSPQEMKICNLIRKRLSNKEIADTLSLSSLTVEKHRHNIRMKLGISNRKINLAAYLDELYGVSGTLPTKQFHLK